MASNDLHRFARIGDTDALRQAIQSGSDINEKDEFGTTALNYAIAAKREDVVRVLLDLGADVTIQSDDGSTALHSAVEHNLPAVLEALLRSCPDAVSIGDKRGNEPLWTAAFNARGNYDMVSVLLQYGADPKHRNNVNLSPLDIPKRKNEPALLQVLEKSHAKPS